MLKEAIEAFTVKLQRPDGERLVLDAYVPKNDEEYCRYYSGFEIRLPQSHWL